jgi:hypothetical protein
MRILKTAMVAAIFFSSSLHAATLTKLGDGISEVSETRATGINNANQVVGYSYTNGAGPLTNHALLWLNDAKNSIAEFAPFMGISSANYARFNAINSSGQAVGTSNQTADVRNSPFGRQRAAVWGVNGTPQQGGWQGLLAPASNGKYAGFPEDSIALSDALAVNNGGAVVGYLTFKEGVDNRPRGAVWLYSNSIWSIYMDGGNYADNNGYPLRDSTFNGISDTGLIVGWSRDGGFYESAQKKPWAWTNVGNNASGMELPCNLGGGVANAVNRTGTVVGNAYVYATPTSQSISRISAIYWSSVTANCTSFPSLGGTYSGVMAIQRDGQAVGSASTTSGQKHAVLYYATGGKYLTIDLNTQLGMTPITALGFAYLEEATGINDSGNIVGYGMQPNGKRAAFKIMGLFGAAPAAPAASATTSAVTMNELGDSPAKTQLIGEEASVQSDSTSQTVELYNVEPLELSPELKQHKH